MHSTSIPNSGNYKVMGIQNSTGTSAYVISGRNNASFSVSNDAYRFTPSVSCSASQTTIVSPSTITVVGTNSLCNGSTTTLTATNNNTYTWTTTSGTLSNSAAIVQTPTATTTYSVGGTNAFGCIANSAVTVTVDNTPTVTAVSTASSGGICPGRTVALSGNGATTYSWTGGITNGVSFTVGSTSNYTVTGTNACGSATAAVSVSIHPTPTIGAVVSQNTICSGNTVTFTGTGGCSNCYTWTAQNNINPSNGVGYFPNGTQNYTVVGANALTCTNSAMTTVTVVTTPLIPPIATPTAICIGSSATISATGASVYSWSPVGTFTGASTSSIVVNPITSTTYTITKSNSNCVDTKTITLVVNPLPFLFTVANPTTVCANNASGLSVGGATSYTWAPGNLPSGSSANNVTVYPSATTDYTVTGFDGNCTNTAVVQVSVNPNPTISVAHTGTVICLNQCTTFTLSGADTYTWNSTPAGPVLNNTIATICPTTSTNYSLSGTNQFSCTSAVQRVVIVNPLPNITSASSPTMVCTGKAAVLSATGAPGPVSYQWSTGSNLNTTTVNPTVPTCYQVTVTNNSTQCRDTRTVCVNVYLPTFQVTKDTSICRGGAITLCASGASSYTWTNTNPPSMFNCITVTPTLQTTYMVSATSNPSNNLSCVSSTQVVVSIYNQPTVTATAEHTIICRGDEVNLMAGGAQTYLWSNSMSGGTITVSPKNITTYTVWGTDQFGCKDTNWVTVRVSACPGWAEHSQDNLFSVFPNPNRGTFMIVSSKPMTLQIFNEIGQMVRVTELNALNGLKSEVSDLSNGIYFLKSPDEPAGEGYKIIVNR